MRVRIYKSPDGKGKVTNKLENWMAQMGGVQAMQDMQQPTQQQVDPETENQIVQLIIPMINEEPSSILNDLVSNKGIPVEIAQPILMKVLTYKKEQEELEATVQKGDEEEITDVVAKENAIKEKSQNDLLVEQMMMQPDQNQDYAAEDQFFTDNLMAYGGVPKKNSYVKSVMKLLKKQQGDEVQTKNVADDTDTGVRKSSLEDFVSGLQTKANNALMQQDAEAMYEQEFKRGGVSRQQRQINKGLNQIVKSIPAGFYNSRMPTMPPMGVIGAQNIMGFPQVPGMQIPGTIKTANIEAKTGLFGRLKEYNIALTYNDAMNSELYKQMLEQQEYNEKNKIEEDIKDYAQNRVDTATDKNEAVQKETGKAEDVSNSKYVVKGTSPVTPQIKSKNPLKAVNNVEDETVDVQEVTTGNWMDNLKNAWGDFSEYSEQAIDNQRAKEQALENWYNENILPTVNPNAAKNLKQPQKKGYQYVSQFTDPNTVYYDPSKSNMIYGRQGNDWYYSKSGDNWNQVTDKSRITQLNKSAKGANLFVLDSKPGVYYRMRGDGSYEKFTGDPNKHTESKKSSGIITTSDPNYGYLNKNKKYSLTFKPTKQFGGFADSSTPELNRFIYGGLEPMTYADNVPMQNTADPFFQYGGLTEYQDKGAVKALSTEELALAKQFNINDPNFSPDGTRAKIKQMQREQWIDQQMQSGSLPGEPGYVPYNNPYIGNMYNPYAAMGYGYPMMTQPGLYPPLFGNRSFRPNNKFIEYAGSWAQQQGLPVDVNTGMQYMGSLAGMRPTKISGKNRLIGPDTWSMEFEVPGVAPGSSINNFPTSKRFYTDAEGNIQDLRPENIQQPNQRGIAGSFGPRDDDFMQNLWQRRAQKKGYDVDWSTDGFVSPTNSNLLPPPQYTDSEMGLDQMVDVQPETFEPGYNPNLSQNITPPQYSDEEMGFNQIVDVQPESFNMADLQSMGYNVTPEDFYNERLANENQMARQQFDIEQMRRGNVQRQYGGDVYKAQFGTSNCPPGYSKDPTTGRCKNLITGEFYKPTISMPSTDDLMQNPLDLDEDYTNPLTGEAPGITMGEDGQYENQGLFTDNDIANQKLKVNFKNKNMFNIDFLAGLNKFNNAANFGVNTLNAFTNKDVQDQFYTNLAFDNQPVKETIDKSFLIGDSQAKLTSRQGGSVYKKGGVTYLSSKQVQDLMKKGYKIEFIK